ncbi:MAG TPA: DUF3071 domain-containing protein [Propionibacterium sp.]|nr:DUF3071 domain-containing protein [Propionibacterium sp.]
MDSALRPREIQARIRAGESLEEVARLSGAPVDRIERFAAPVLAEREYVAGLALTSSVRRRGDLSGHRTLSAVANEHLTAHDTDPESVIWDAWRNEDKRWTIVARWTEDDEERTAQFLFDLGSRFSVADDAQARWLLAEDDEAAEYDELALVRAVGGDPSQPNEPAADAEGKAPAAGSPSPVQPVADADEEPTITLDDVPAHVLRTVGQEDSVEVLPRSAATPQEIREELEAEIDAYGMVPEGRSELDVLYDMLGGIAEDSINIYAGLNDPIVSEPPADPTPAAADQPEPDRTPPAQPDEATTVRPPTPTPTTEAVSLPSEDSAHAADPSSEDRPEAPTTNVSRLRPAPTPPSTGPGTPASGPQEQPGITAPDSTSTSQPGQPTPPATAQGAEETPTAGPGGDQTTPGDEQRRTGQPSLVDDEPTIQVAPGAAKRRGSRRKRASVPSWDEIMFGGPKPGD